MVPSLLLTAIPKHNGRVAIVTGGARGMGFEIARHLARLGMHVVIGRVLCDSLVLPMSYLPSLNR